MTIDNLYILIFHHFPSDRGHPAKPELSTTVARHYFCSDHFGHVTTSVKLRAQETVGILPPALEELARSRLIQSSELVVACKDNNFDKVERLLRESRVQILDVLGVLDPLLQSFAFFVSLIIGTQGARVFCRFQLQFTHWCPLSSPSQSYTSSHIFT